MSINKDTVKYVAHLARIQLKDDELEKLSRELDSIIGFIDKLNKLDVKGIAPTSHILPINNLTRQDENRPSLTTDDALKNSPQRIGNFFGVPKVIE